MTPTLSFGYWPSFNVPFFPEVRCWLRLQLLAVAAAAAAAAACPILRRGWLAPRLASGRGGGGGGGGAPAAGQTPPLHLGLHLCCPQELSLLLATPAPCFAVPSLPSTCSPHAFHLPLPAFRLHSLLSTCPPPLSHPADLQRLWLPRLHLQAGEVWAALWADHALAVVSKLAAVGAPGRWVRDGAGRLRVPLLRCPAVPRCGAGLSEGLRGAMPRCRHHITITRSPAPHPRTPCPTRVPPPGPPHPACLPPILPPRPAPSPQLQDLQAGPGGREGPGRHAGGDARQRLEN